RQAIEGWISAILIAMVDVTMRSLQEIEDGGLTARTKRQGGDLVAKLYRLQQLSHDRFDFTDAVRRGSLQLCQRRSMSLTPAAADEFAASIIATVAKVSTAMRAELN